MPSLPGLSLAVFTQLDRTFSVESSLVAPLSSPQTPDSGLCTKGASHSIAGRSLR